MLNYKPVTRGAYKLLHDASLALSNIERNGMRVDIGYLDKSLKTARKRIKKMEDKFKSTKIWRIWKKRFGEKAKLSSREQLASILFEELKYESKAVTATGKFKADEAALEGIDHPFVRNYIKLEKLKKANGTYLTGIRREAVNGFVHPNFNLHKVITYRSSSDNPNFQNMPIRNPEMAKIIRRAFIPRKNHVIVEIDYSGVEVCVSVCYNNDPKLRNYIIDKKTDMHRDMAGECYKLKTKEIHKAARQQAKGSFVFAQFYGDWYISCAKGLWEGIERNKLTTVDGTCLFKHLKKQGVKELGDLNPKEKPRPGTFEKHIQEVEDRFWNTRFKVYSQWKKDWWDAYCENGGFSMHTGFSVHGVFSRNEVINSPVQGSAFHCLLWSIIKMNGWLVKNKMKSKIVGQIHDSIVGDVHIDELDDYLAKARQVMTVDLCKKWKWITVPLNVEADVTPVNGTWYDKEEVEI